ncbi:glycosyltransferase [Celeribacter indicus]|uniref:Group 1 glycosyl transferase n=1 Tax=Celeribacter indicus TaxID=1208324 RepID=A0A0B5DXD4_9RHOB|nr:glycosyltransferase [Celeribacter indicus]AJE45416.1 group 1 glycosyl transferase [Celeribacter indicus]SDX01422.1 Glycosyltransferase involved in cell wall bisynthesis [Celeribacter indicus]
MKICIATGGYHKPGETFVNRHISELFGGNTCVICNKFSGTNPYDKSVAVRRNDSGVRSALSLGALRDKLRYKTLRAPRGEAKQRLIRFLAEEKPDAILAEFGPEAVALSPLAHELGLPIFSYFRGYDASKDLRKASNVRAYRRWIPELAGVFAVSQFLLDNLARHGISNPRSLVIPSGVNTALFRPAEKRPSSFLFVGRLIEKKSPDHMIRAFCDTAERVPEAHLTVIGEGPLSETCARIAQERGMAGRITLTGPLPHEEVRAHMARTAVLIQHSVTAANGNTEGLPTSIQEALAAGMAVVSTRHAGIPEAVIEGQNGLLVEERDFAGFGAAITALAEDPERVARFGARGRALAEERFDNRMLLAKLETQICAWSAA